MPRIFGGTSLARTGPIPPGYSEAHRLLGQVLFQQGEIDKGMDEVLEALLIDPKNMWALIMMGNILANGKNNVDAADKYYKKVLEYYPDNAIALNNVAGTLIRRKDYDSAIRYMNTIKRTIWTMLLNTQAKGR